jgi:hypothetical protein
VTKAIPILYASDIAATLRWYRSIGFAEVGRYPQDGSRVFWGMVKLGAAELMFDVRVPDAAGTTLLLVTDRIDDVYQFLKSRQMKNAGDRHETTARTGGWSSSRTCTSRCSEGCSSPYATRMDTRCGSCSKPDLRDRDVALTVGRTNVYALTIVKDPCGKRL